jgi:mercuric ion binding protein
MRLLTRFIFAAALALAAPATLAQTTRTVTLDVQNMTCAGCAIAVRTALKRVEGVVEAKVDLDANAATVKFDPSKASVDALTRATAAVGFPSKARD